MSLAVRVVLTVYCKSDALRIFAITHPTLSKINISVDPTYSLLDGRLGIRSEAFNERSKVG
jgi:hypothetical protein